MTTERSRPSVFFLGAAAWMVFVLLGSCATRDSSVSSDAVGPSLEASSPEERYSEPVPVQTGADIADDRPEPSLPMIQSSSAQVDAILAEAEPPQPEAGLTAGAAPVDSRGVIVAFPLPDLAESAAAPEDASPAVKIAGADGEAVEDAEAVEEGDEAHNTDDTDDAGETPRDRRVRSEEAPVIPSPAILSPAQTPSAERPQPDGRDGTAEAGTRSFPDSLDVPAEPMEEVVREPSGEIPTGARNADNPPAFDPPREQTSSQRIAAEEVAPATPVPPPELEQRSAIPVSAGSVFEVRLPGPLWVYLGSDGVVEFIRRSTEGNDSVFSFRLPGNAPPGVPELRFEAQDLATGAIQRRLVALEPTDARGESEANVGNVGEIAAAGGIDRSTPASGDLPTEAAQEERSLTDRVASAIDTDGSVADHDGTLAGDLRTALEEGTHESIDADQIRRLIDRFIAEGDLGSAVSLLESLVNNEWRPYDRFLFTLAQLYERHGPERDLRRARSLYAELVDLYPLSPHWGDARSRIEYLDRHFFLIR